MSVLVGNFVSFFGLEEDFKHVKLKDIDLFVDECSWYEVEDVGDTWLDVRAADGVRTIHVNEAYDEYQVYTKEGLREHLKVLKNNTNYADICNKIKQLYRKQEFKFQGA
jgi:hypothetical protein